MKTAIVTGASSGIGLEITTYLLQKEYKVYAIGRNFTDTFKASLNLIPVVCNLTKLSDLTEKISVIKKENEIELLVNNAGVGYFGPHEELSPGKIHEMVAVNLEAPLTLTQLLLRDLKKYKGTVINISSVTANKSNTYGCAYGATKAGLSSFSASLFDEVRKYGVKVVTIHPDMTKTNFYRNANFKEGDTLDTYLLPKDVVEAVDLILSSREGIVLKEITLVPQRHQLGKNKI